MYKLKAEDIQKEFKSQRRDIRKLKKLAEYLYDILNYSTVTDFGRERGKDKIHKTLQSINERHLKNQRSNSEKEKELWLYGK